MRINCQIQAQAAIGHTHERSKQVNLFNTRNDVQLHEVGFHRNNAHRQT